MRLRILLVNAGEASLDFLYSLLEHVCSAALRFHCASIPPLALAMGYHTGSGRAVDKSRSKSFSLHITGIGAEWPPNSYGPEPFEEHIRQQYDITKPG